VNSLSLSRARARARFHSRMYLTIAPHYSVQQLVDNALKLNLRVKELEQLLRNASLGTSVPPETADKLAEPPSLNSSSMANFPAPPMGVWESPRSVAMPFPVISHGDMEPVLQARDIKVRRMPVSLPMFRHEAHTNVAFRRSRRTAMLWLMCFV
jgi:hypothetical protein